MKKILPLAVFAAAFAACKKAETPQAAAPAAAPVENSATQYVGGLQNDVKKAEAAAALATQSIKQTQSGVNQANEAQ